MIRGTVKLSASGFQKKLRAYEASKVEANCVAVATLAVEVCDQMIEYAEPHRDTNRFVRSLEMARAQLAVRAGQTAAMPRAIRSSKRADEIRERLEISVIRAERQERKLMVWVRENEARPDFDPNWPSHRKLMRELDKAGDITDRAVEALDAFDQASPGERESAIVVFGTKARRKAQDARIRITTRNLDRVVIREFGGRGAVICGSSSGRAAFATIASMEPHARIVDRRYRIGVRAMASARQLGVRTFNRTYLQRLSKDSGVNINRLTGLDRGAA